MPRFLGPPDSTVVLEYFGESHELLVNEVPEHMVGAADPTAELYLWLVALAEQIDALSLAAEQVYADARLATATAEGLTTEWAYVYGLGSEIANLNTEQLRSYIEQWIACDGSTKSIENLLLAIINLDPANNGGPLLTFPGGGGGLTFATGGSGVGPLYQYTSKPDQTVGFVFPSDGSGLAFPDQALYFSADGSGLTLTATFPNVPNLTFPNSAWVVLTETFQSYLLNVSVKSYLAFDRGAFKRAIARFAQAHTLTSYTESNT